MAAQVAHRILRGRDLGVPGRILVFRAFAALVDQQILVKLFDHIQSQQVLDGRSDQSGGIGMRGVSLDLLAVEQKQMCDIGRKELFDLRGPVICQCRFCVTVLEDFKLFLASAIIGLPIPAQVIMLFGSFHGMAKGDLYSGFGISGSFVDTT